jgi:hypothetical protein
VVKKIPLSTRLILTVALSFQSISLVQAAVLRVSQTDAACSGGKSLCYPTIQAAVEAARGGDMVEIEPGVYREKITIASKNTSPAAGEDDRIVIAAAAPDTVTIVEPGQPDKPDDDKSPQAADREARGLIMIHHSRYVTLRSLTIAGSKAAGIQLRGDQSGNFGIHLERNRLFGNGSRFGEGGIMVGPGNAGTVIINNLVYSNRGNGIRIEGPAAGPSVDGPSPSTKPQDDGGDEEVFLVENTIHGNGWNGVTVDASQPVMLVSNAITANGTADASEGGRVGVALRGSPASGSEGLSLYNNLICGNRLGETSGEVFAGQHADNRTPLGTEATGVIATPECASSGGVYEASAGLDGRPGTRDDDFKLLEAGTGHLPSPAIDRGADPLALGLDLHFEPALYAADYAAPDARPVDKDINRPLDYDVGARELPCGCTNVCFSQCSIRVDPATGSSREVCAPSPFWDPGTQCCDSTTGQVDERHLGEAMTACPDTRVQNPAFSLCDDTDGCSAGNPLNKQNPTDPLEVCGPHFRFGTLDPKEDLPCNNHDCCYETCNRTKNECDLAFNSDMLAVCNQPVSGFCATLVPDCIGWTATYFDGVVALSGSSYTNGQNRSCQCCLNK